MELSHAIAYMDELESQVAMYDKALSSLQFRRKQLLQSIKTHKSILSPIRRLPPEILGEIFSLIVRATFHSSGYTPLPVTQHAPWLLTRVCRHWSAVALATPTLWSMIYVNLDHGGYRGAVPLVKLSLARSGSAALIVRFYKECGCDDNSHLVEILDAILSSSDQWRTAHFTEISSFPSSYEFLRRLARVRGLSNLETLRISMDLQTPDGDDFDPAFWNIFAVAPQLTSLEALFWESGLRHAPFSLPWHQLTRVRTTFASNTEALSTLGKLPNIVECKFAFRRNLVLPTDSRTIHLPYLHSLVLQVEPELRDPVVVYQKHTSLLGFLETPRLQNLTTHATADEEDVLSLITRSNCAASLTSFRFHSSSINHSMILHVVQKMARLSSLRIEDFNETLLPRTSLPAFVRTFAKEATQAELLARQSLHVWIVDQQFSEEEAHDLNIMLATMHQDGLCIMISPTPHLPCIISDDFHY
ncbi:hypothetical protein C8R45DRAFT_924387 [Mycena sanguinolenta]|nr:hypothetical protein C8R45DRAFT_924387 [Mycena sanguinolenta]